MTYQPGSTEMQIFDSLPFIVRRALTEAIQPPTAAAVVEALRRSKDPHGVAGRIRAIDAGIRARQQFEIDELLNRESYA